MTDPEFVHYNHISSMSAFLASIDWQDPWLMALIVFHITVTLMAVLTRNYGNLQAVLFFILILMVYFSEGINQIASANWRLFSRQQYFDSKGVFISVVFSIPILLNCMIMVGCWLWQSSQLMRNVNLARIEEFNKLRREKRQQIKEGKERLLKEEQQPLKED